MSENKEENKENEMEEMYQAGSFIAHVLNKMKEADRYDYLKAHIGAMLILVKLDKNKKLKALEDVKRELEAEDVITADPDPDPPCYIG